MTCSACRAMQYRTSQRHVCSGAHSRRSPWPPHTNLTLHQAVVHKQPVALSPEVWHIFDIAAQANLKKWLLQVPSRYWRERLSRNNSIHKVWSISRLMPTPHWQPLGCHQPHPTPVYSGHGKSPWSVLRGAGGVGGRGAFTGKICPGLEIITIDTFWAFRLCPSTSSDKDLLQTN